MAVFSLVSDWAPAGDQPAAITALARGLALAVAAHRAGGAGADHGAAGAGAVALPDLVVGAAVGLVGVAHRTADLGDADLIGGARDRRASDVAPRAPRCS